MANVNYNLLYKENSDAGVIASVKSFVNLEAAREAMKKSFAVSNNLIKFPPSSPNDPHYSEDENYTSISENGIHVTMGMDTYDWEITEVEPADDIAKNFDVYLQLKEMS